MSRIADLDSWTLISSRVVTVVDVDLTATVQSSRMFRQCLLDLYTLRVFFTGPVVDGLGPSTNKAILHRSRVASGSKSSLFSLDNRYGSFLPSYTQKKGLLLCQFKCSQASGCFLLTKTVSAHEPGFSTHQ